MNELFKVNYDNERITLSARDLFEFLECNERFSRWWERMSGYGFVDGVDFTSVQKCTVVNNGAKRDIDDYQITIEMAKEIAMLQRNEKGKQARQYFIELEKKWNSPEAVINRALEYSRKQVKALMLENSELKPKAIFADAVSASKTSILVGELAKVLKANGIDIGQKRLFAWLRDNHYLMQKGESYNLPTQKSMDLGLMEIKKSTVNNADGSIRTVTTTKITGKGQVYFVNKFLNAQNDNDLHN